MSWSVDDLEVFRRAYEASLEVHRVSRGWPRAEQYGGVADQLRRSSKSICALLAEGVGRQRSSDAEFRRYCVMALGSADETGLWLRYARDLDFLAEEAFAHWCEEYRVIARMLQGLIRRMDHGVRSSED